MLNFIRATWRRFRASDSGLSAIEFAFIAPIMVSALLGSAEMSNAMVADRKVSEAASTVADLVAQSTTLSNADVTNILDCGTTIMAPLPAGTLGIRVTSVVMGANSVARVAWSDARNMSTRAVNSVVALPAGLIALGESVVYTEIQYTFTSPFGDFLIGGVVMQDSFLLRPRRSLTITRIA